jgi:hypothetical protein
MCTRVVKLLLVTIAGCLGFLCTNSAVSNTSVTELSDVAAARLFGAGDCEYESTIRNPPIEFITFCGPDGTCDAVAISIRAGDTIKSDGTKDCGTTAGCKTYPNLKSCSGE